MARLSAAEKKRMEASPLKADTKKRVAELQAKMAQAAKKPTAALARTLPKASKDQKAAKPSRLPFDGGKPAEPMPPAAEPEERKKPPPGFKMPKALGAVADLLYTTRNARLALGKQETALEVQEKYIKGYLIDILPKSQSNGVAGTLCRVSIDKDDVPQVKDWGKLYAAIVKDYLDHVKRKTGQQDGAFAVLNRAINAATVKDMWAANKKVAGVEAFTVVKVGINKI